MDCLIGSTIDILPRLKTRDSHGTAPLSWESVGYDVACSRGAKYPLSESNKYVGGCANQPLLLFIERPNELGDTFCRMFSAPFTSEFATILHESHTYKQFSGYSSL
jgi:hypothetical protein